MDGRAIPTSSASSLTMVLLFAVLVHLGFQVQFMQRSWRSDGVEMSQSYSESKRHMTAQMDGVKDGVLTLLKQLQSASRDVERLANASTESSLLLQQLSRMDIVTTGDRSPRSSTEAITPAQQVQDTVSKDSPQVEARGMGEVNIVDLKFPWNTDLLRSANTSDEMTKRELLGGMLPPNVFFFWCGGKDRWFEFKHYLSIISATKSLKVDTLFFLYEAAAPLPDKKYYNLWYEDLKHDLPFLVPRQMTDWQMKYCQTADGLEKLEIILQSLNEEGGLFLSENTWLLPIDSARRQLHIEFGFDVDQMEGFVMMQKGAFRAKSSDKPALALLYETGGKVQKTACIQIARLTSASNAGSCVVVKGGQYDRIWPMTVWERDDPFGRISRKIFYGTEQIRKPEPNYDSLVPNIGHMVWIGGGPMSFMFYLSVLSFLFVAKVDTVYIHGDQEPAGPYWKKVMTEERTRHRVHFVMRSPPLEIYQGEIQPGYRALMSDLIRVDLMIKYGGIYADTDAIWSKPLTLEDRAYDAVASYDWIDWSWPYPDSVNFGVSYGKKNAPFWRIFQDSMRKLINHHHGFTGVMMPYKLLEKYPHLLRIDRHLQAICFLCKCHPIWVDGYHDESKHHLNMHSLDNWREDLNAFHWTYPDPPEFANMTALLQANSTFADLGRFVLTSAGIIP